MSKRYVLIDYQNVQPVRASYDDPSRVQLLVFVGANQAEASARRRLGDNAQYIKISGEGRNALDFHIAYYIGELVTKEPDCDVWIVSKDNGFRHLVDHLTQKKFKIHRVTDLAFVQEAPADGARRPGTAPAIDPRRFAVIAAHLGSENAKARPTKVQSLSNFLKSLLTKRPTRAEINAYTEELKRRGIVALENQKVSYSPRK